MTQKRQILGWVLLVFTALPTFAASRRFPIRTELIASALTGIGIQVLPEQVVLLTDVVATTSAPRLTVRSMEKSSDHRIIIRLECDVQEECLPFFVSIRPEDGNDPQQSSVKAGMPLLSAPAFNSRSKTVAIRSGSPAILLLDGDRVHIQISVICLESGARGQRIRVTSPDHRQTYTAEVIDGTLLKGKL
ncbi:MAG TPA: hypothetical protein VMU48_06740 [Terracidiphilus sp.]|nr:hypothetical protein [Terracidiphilus sp.]